MRQGQPAQILCTLAHNTPFEGKAKAELLGLPPGASAAPVEFTKDTKELVFEVKTTKDTPAGSHKSLFCQVTITQNGEPIVGTVGTTELQVNEPPAAAPAAPPTAKPRLPRRPPPRRKPLSRLEQLRAKALQTGGEETMNEIRSAIIALRLAVAARRCAAPASARRQQRADGTARLSQPDRADHVARCANGRRSSRVCRRHHARRDRQSRVEARSRRLSSREGNHSLPKADGDAKLTVTFESASVDVPISVKQATVDPPISFKLDVMPVFMKAGCNTGSCHGSARGKDGFRLSLFGFDPDGDYYRITREQPERRIDLSIPSECLLIEKATGQVPHSGGSPTKKGDPLHATLLRWLESGAPADAGEVPTLDALEVYPPTRAARWRG